jgi:hypothetical protein
VERGREEEKSGGNTTAKAAFSFAIMFGGIYFMFFSTLFNDPFFNNAHLVFTAIGAVIFFLGILLLFSKIKFGESSHAYIAGSDDSFGPHSSMDESCPVTGTDFIGTSSSSYFRD